MLELLTALAPLLAPTVGLVAGIKFVREGERAIMLRFGKAIKRRGKYKVIKPGLKLMIPGVHKLARIHVRQRTINFPAQTIILSDNTVFEVGAVLMCRVKDSAQDLYNSLFETTGINTALTDYGLMVVREVLGGEKYTSLYGEAREKVSEELMRKIQPRASEWGVEVISLQLSDCDPNEETARLIQTSAQTSFKLAALQKVAEELKLSHVSQLDPSFASVLIGAPLVATASSVVNQVIHDKEE